MGNPALALQIAVRDALASDAGLTALLGAGKVFDDVPQKTALPYVTVGEIATSDWSTQESRGAEHTVTVRAWSGHRGRKEAHTLIGEIDRVLDGASLELDGHRLINLRVVFWTVLQDLDGETYQGIVRLRAVTEAE